MGKLDEYVIKYDMGFSEETLEYNVHLDEALLENCSLTPRNSKDTNVNEFGRQLLDICRHHNLLILNGKIIGDWIGECTSFH